MPAEGFSGAFELSLGSVVGVRAFEVDHLGRLTGVSKTDQVFRPGANKATCWRCDTNNMDICECGFYAYFKGQDNHFVKGNPVGGIIEGTGRTVVGTKGFRTENAQLLALFPIKNRGLAATNRPWITSWTRWIYPTANWFREAEYTVGALNAVISVLFAIVGLVIGVISLFTSNWELGTWILPIALYSAGWFRRSFLEMEADDYSHLCWPGKDRRVRKTPDPFVRIKQLYPDVPVYRSMRAAMRKFPLTTAEASIPELPSPETKDDFWELPAENRR